MIDVKLLEDFREMKISKKDLCHKLEDNLVVLTTNKPVKICIADVINMLNAYRIGKYSINEVLDWVNTMWFTELFSYNDQQCDSIASIMNKLEELDENSEVLSSADVEKYILALKNNQEI